MKTKQFSLLFILLTTVLLFCSSCSEFTSADISGKTITAYGPTDSLYTSATAISFFWEADDDFENYHLQVVSPDYTSPTLVWDSTFRAYSKLLSLASADAAYSWRLLGVNEGSTSDTIQRSFYIDVTDPFKASSLIPPGDSLDSGDSLKWTSHDSFLGQSYTTIDSLFISSVNDSTQFPVSLLQTRGVNSYPLSASGLSTGDYWWKVNSKDAAGNVSNSNLFHFYHK